MQKPCSVLGLLTSSRLFLRCSSKFSARTKEKWIWCFGLKRFCACPAKWWAGWLASLNNVAWGRHCKRQSTRANTERCSIHPKEVPKFNRWGEKEVLLLCEAYNAPVNVSRPCLTTLRLHIFQGLWYLLLTLGKGAVFTPFFQTVASKKREERGAAPNLLLAALEGKYAQSVSSLPRREKILSQKASKFSLSWQRYILFPVRGKWIQHVWAQEVRKQIFIMGDIENISNKPW